MYICDVVFFVKQKTAYEMRIRDWSSDVCSADLRTAARIQEFQLSDPTSVPKRVFPTARRDAAVAEQVTSSPQTQDPAYRLAFQDPDFLLREDFRLVRFQLELLKPEVRLDEANIGSTFVFYGSARIPAPDDAQALIDAEATPVKRRIAERPAAKAETEGGGVGKEGVKK